MWQLQSLRKLSGGRDWHSGDALQVVLADDEAHGDGASKTYTWHYSLEQTPGEFVDMVRFEANAFLGSLRSAAARALDSAEAIDLPLEDAKD
jgi:hypothetical protein